MVEDSPAAGRGQSNPELLRTAVLLLRPLASAETLVVLLEQLRTAALLMGQLLINHMLRLAEADDGGVDGGMRERKLYGPLETAEPVS